MRWPWQRKATSPIPVNNGGFFAGRSFAGTQVTEKNAIGLSAHFACVRLIATTLASLPIHIYERTGDSGKKRRNDHPSAVLLRSSPNPDMTSFSFVEAMQAQICNRGAAFAELVFDRKGNVAEIWPMPPGEVQPIREKKDGPLTYKLSGAGAMLPAWKVLHIPGLGFDGINAFSPVQLFRQAIGLGMAVEEFGARFFGQGTHIGGFLEHPQKMNPESYERLKVSTAEKYQGLQKSHGLIILEEGMKYSKIGMPLEDIQFIESRKFTATEMARIHGVPPHLIGDLEKATFSNIEEQSIEAIVYLFRPWAIRWEQALNAKLFTEKEREKLYVKFELDGLLRGNIKSRYEAYSIGLQQGFLNSDEVREKEDMNPLPDGQGKVYRFPLNLGESKKEQKMIKANELQRREIALEGSDFETNARNDDGSGGLKIKGTPVVYNRECVIYENDHFRLTEIIEPGAAREALLRAEQVLLWNHDSAKPMAARKNNTLSVREDASGVYIDADISGTVWGRDGHEAIQSGLVDKMSFGFYMKDDGYTEERFVENGKRCCKRTLKKFDRIVDFSPVTYPAYQDTGVSARDAESILREFDADEEKRNETKDKITALLDEFPEITISA